MQIAGNPKRVKLNVDLTGYDSRCKVGELGWTIPDFKFCVWGSQDRYVAVRFNNGAGFDIRWESLEVLSE